jgi:hypothetical protein
MKYNLVELVQRYSHITHNNIYIIPIYIYTSSISHTCPTRASLTDSMPQASNNKSTRYHVIAMSSDVILLARNRIHPDCHVGNNMGYHTSFTVSVFHESWWGNDLQRRATDDLMVTRFSTSSSAQNLGHDPTVYFVPKKNRASKCYLVTWSVS